MSPNLVTILSPQFSPIQAIHRNFHQDGWQSCRKSDRKCLRAPTSQYGVTPLKGRLDQRVPRRPSGVHWARPSLLTICRLLLGPSWDFKVLELRDRFRSQRGRYGFNLNRAAHNWLLCMQTSHCWIVTGKYTGIYPGQILKLTLQSGLGNLTTHVSPFPYESLYDFRHAP